MAGGQNFLGARWVRGLLALTPPSWRPGVALWLLGLSPHYFHGRDRHSEARRHRRSREVFVRDVLAPYLAPEQDLLDVGCGPGYLSRAVAGRVWSVSAVDISRGVLACARVLNPATNIDYRTPRQFLASGRRVDIAVSLAVAQHLSDDELLVMLTSIWPTLRPGGRLLLHVVVDDPDWRTEREWRSRTGLAARLRRRYGLHCYGRTREQAVRLVERAGFTDVEVIALRILTDLDDDVVSQHLLVAHRPDDTGGVLTRPVTEQGGAAGRVGAVARPDRQVVAQEPRAGA